MIGKICSNYKNSFIAFTLMPFIMHTRCALVRFHVKKRIKINKERLKKIKSYTLYKSLKKNVLIVEMKRKNVH